MIFVFVLISQMLRQAETLRTDCQLYLPLLGDLLDYSGNGFNGAAVGQLTTVTDPFGRENSAYHFDANSYVFTGSTGLSGAERTLAFWMKTDMLFSPTSGRGQVVVSYGGGICGTSFLLNFNNDGRSPRNTYEVQGHCGVNLVIDTGAPSPVGAWQHLAVTTSAAGGTIIYLNGAAVIRSPIFISNTNTFQKLFSIGKSIHSSGASVYDDNKFQGSISGVMLYGSALSDAEIYELFTNRPPVLNKNEFSVIENTPFIITPAMLSATDISFEQQSNLHFIISDIKNGYFEFTNAFGTPITTFTQQQIMSNAVRFVPDGSAHAPAFKIKVSDGLLWTTPVPASIVFNLQPQNGAPVLVGTLPSKSAKVGVTQMFAIPENIFNDNENDAITLSMEAVSIDFNNQYAFSSDTDILTLTPSVSGTSHFRFFATDSHGARSVTGADLFVTAVTTDFNSTNDDANTTASSHKQSSVPLWVIDLAIAVGSGLLLMLIGHIIKQGCKESYKPIRQENEMPGRRTYRV